MDLSHLTREELWEQWAGDVISWQHGVLRPHPDDIAAYEAEAVASCIATQTSPSTAKMTQSRTRTAPMAAPRPMMTRLSPRTRTIRMMR
eukprot:915031-Pyramimonas_sp.AAC.1